MSRNFTLICLIAPLLAGCLSVADNSALLGRHGMTLAPQQACATNPAANTDTGLDPTGFAVSSWNIYKEQLEGWNQDLETLAEESDILMLQEASLEPEFQSWLGEQLLEWDMNPAFSYRGVSSGVMTMGNLAADSNCGQLLAEPWLRIPKAILASYYPIRDQEESLLVINIHAVNFTLGTGDLERQLRLTNDYLANHSGPVVLAGDFNTWSQGRMAALGDFAEGHNMQAASFVGQQPSLHLGNPVDHVFYRDLELIDRRVEVVESSDHYPLLVRFAVPTTL